MPHRFGDPAIRATHLGHSIIECVLLTGTCIPWGQLALEPAFRVISGEICLCSQAKRRSLSGAGLIVGNLNG